MYLIVYKPEVVGAWMKGCSSGRMWIAAVASNYKQILHQYPIHREKYIKQQWTQDLVRDQNRSSWIVCCQIKARKMSHFQNTRKCTCPINKCRIPQYYTSCETSHRD
jgi:hypothetical protein